MKYFYYLLFLLSTNAYTMSTFVKATTPQLNLSNSNTFTKLVTNHKTIATQTLLYKYILADLFTKNPHINIQKFISNPTIFKKNNNPSARFDLLESSEIFYSAIAHVPWDGINNDSGKYSVIIGNTPLTLHIAKFYFEKLKSNCLEIYCPENLTKKSEYPEVHKRFEEFLGRY